MGEGGAVEAKKRSMLFHEQFEEEESRMAEQQLQSLVDYAVRVVPGVFSDLLAQHLALAVGADVLVKVKLACEAAMMLPDEFRRGLGLSDEELDVLYRNAISLLCSKPSPNGTYSIGWAFEFTAESFKRYVEPWYGEVRDPVTWLKETYAKDLHPAIFFLLKSRFACWAWPRVMRVFEKLSRVVEPQLYREVLKIMRGGGAEKSEGSLGQV